MVQFVWHKCITTQFVVFSCGGLGSVIIWVGGLQDLRVRI